VFNRFMTMQSKLQNAAIVANYDFSEAQTVVDVGGGHGATLAAVLPCAVSRATRCADRFTRGSLQPIGTGNIAIRRPLPSCRRQSTEVRASWRRHLHSQARNDGFFR